MFKVTSDEFDDTTPVEAAPVEDVSSAELRQWNFSVLVSQKFYLSIGITYVRVVSAM